MSRLPVAGVRSVAPLSARDGVRAIVILAIAVLAFASSVASLAVLWTPHASLGFGVEGTRVTAVAPVSAAASAGIRKGDVLSPQTPLGVHLRTLWYDAYRPGQSEQITFANGAGSKTATLVAVAHPPPFNRIAEALIASRVLLYIIFVVVGTSLVLLRPAGYTWGFFFCCIGLATIPAFTGWSFTVLDPILGIVAYAATLGLTALANIGFVAFALRFPTDELSPRRLIVWRSLPLWLAGLLGVYAWTTLAWYWGTDVPAWVLSANDAVGFLAWIVGTIALVTTYRSTAERNRRRLQWVIVGCSIGYLAWYLDQVLVHLGFVVAGRLIGVATVAMPISVAYAVLKHRVIDFRFVLSRAVTYSALASALVVALALSSWLTAAFLIRGHAQLIVQIVFAVIVGASLQRVYRSLERALEHAVFRRLRNAGTDLDRVAAAMESATARDAVESLLTDAPVEALELEYAASYRREAGGDYTRTHTTGTASSPTDRLTPHDSLVQLVTRSSAPLTTASGAVGLAVGTSAGAFILFGPHRNGFALDPDEVALLQAFVRRAGPVYDGLTRTAATTAKLGRLLQLPATLYDSQFAATLAEHILDALPAEDYRVLAACAAVPDATADDVAFVAGSRGANAQLADLTAAEFASRTARGRYRVHPLLLPTLAKRTATTTGEIVARCAQRCFDAGEYLRASELFDTTGDRTTALAALAAEALRGVRDAEAFDALLHRLFASASAREAAQFPELLLARVRKEGAYVDDGLFREAAQAAVDHLGDDQAEIRGRLAMWLAVVYAETGALRAAIDLVERFDESGSSIVRAIIAGKQGRLEQCEALARACEQRAPAFDDGLPAAYGVRATYVERVRGRWSEAQALTEVALARELPSGSRRAVMADAAFGAWLAGGETPDASSIVLPPNDVFPRFAACAKIVRAVSAADRVEAQLLARLALDAATVAGEPFLLVIALVCLFEIGARKQIEHLAHAAAIAESIASEPLREAVASMIGAFGDCGVLQPLIGRIRAARAETASLSVETAAACVRRGTDVVSISERELALVLALAQHPRPHATATLIDTLWPDLDEANGAKALQTCVYRVRLRLGDAGAIVSVAQGYHLGATVAVDLPQAESFLATLGASACDDPFVRLRLEAITRHFGEPRPAATLGWEWYDALERRIVAVARESRRLLAEHHLRSGEPGRAMTLARAMLVVDELDEGAREIAIRAHLAAGSPGEAWREVRLHREALARDFHGDVPSSLWSLLPPPERDQAFSSDGERLVSEGSQGS